MGENFEPTTEDNAGQERKFPGSGRKEVKRSQESKKGGFYNQKIEKQSDEGANSNEVSGREEQVVPTGRADKPEQQPSHGLLDRASDFIRDLWPF